MARFEALAVEDLERMAREAYARSVPPREAAPPKPRNAAPLLHVLGGERVAFGFRGVAYEILPVSFDDGVRLVEARAALDAAADESRLTPEVARDARTALRFVASLAPRYMRPLRIVRRLLWHLGLRTNPYRRATEREVGQLLGFFLTCRTMSRARPLAA